MRWLLLIGVIYMDGSKAMYEFQTNDCKAMFEGVSQAIGPRKEIVGVCKPIA